MTWYYKSHTGMELGPVSPLELLDLIRNGSVLRDTQVKKKDSQWVKAEEVNGLMATASKPSIAYYCESCGKQVAKPPCRCLNCDMHLDKATQKLVQHDLDEVDRKTRKALAKAKFVTKEPAQKETQKKTESSRAVVSDTPSNGDMGRANQAASRKVPAQSNQGDSVGWLSWLRGKR
jgi:hypothetical protein